MSSKNEFSFASSLFSNNLIQMAFTWHTGNHSYHLKFRIDPIFAFLQNISTLDVIAYKCHFTNFYYIETHLCSDVQLSEARWNELNRLNKIHICDIFLRL